MKFTVSSQALLHLLSTASRVVSTKNTYPILDYFHLELKGSELTVMTSDLETTMKSSISVDSVEVEGQFAAPVKLMLDTLKEFADMPLLIEVDEQSWAITINYRSGSLSIPGANPASYPAMTQIADERREITIDVENLVGGINRSIFATADDDLRPIMTGLYFHIQPTELTFVATDAHKLVKCSIPHSSDINASFILPKKPSMLLKNLLAKAEDIVDVSFDSKNVMFSFKNTALVCRLIDGNYPNYNAVIPTNNPNKVLVDRLELLNAIRRVAVCSNPTTNLIRLEVAENVITLNAQDIDFSVSANESVSCNYTSDPIVIGFKSTFLIEILSNIESTTILIELADSTRAGLFKPVADDETTQSGESLMLLMPMMLNS